MSILEALPVLESACCYKVVSFFAINPVMKALLALARCCIYLTLGSLLVAQLVYIIMQAWISSVLFRVVRCYIVAALAMTSECRLDRCKFNVVASRALAITR